ncbi:MAG: hypothetical protein ACOCWQ_02795 [Nanoarchaeota archaeon]
MAPINPYLLIGVGAVVSFVSWINPEARPKLVLFFWIGMALFAWGLLRLLWRAVTSRKKEAVPDGQQQPRQSNQAPHPQHQTWHHTPHDGYRQQQFHAAQQQVIRCPNCGGTRPAHFRFCPHCGYGV